eukprot:1806835-Rhodomonas_salina.2
MEGRGKGWLLSGSVHGQRLGAQREGEKARRECQRVGSDHSNTNSFRTVNTLEVRYHNSVGSHSVGPFSSGVRMAICKKLGGASSWTEEVEWGEGAVCIAAGSK